MPGSNTRLESLDILRGLDLFILVAFQPVFMRLAQVRGTITVTSIKYF